MQDVVLCWILLELRRSAVVCRFALQRRDVIYIHNAMPHWAPYQLAIPTVIGAQSLDSVRMDVDSTASTTNELDNGARLLREVGSIAARRESPGSKARHAIDQTLCERALR